MTSDERRTMTFAWYSALQDAGHAVGSLLAGLPTLLQTAGGLAPLPSSRLTLTLFPLLSLVVLGLYLRISPAVEIAETRRPLSPRARSILWRISSLFALDGIGGGLLVTTLLSYYFFERFGASALSVAPSAWRRVRASSRVSRWGKSMCMPETYQSGGTAATFCSHEVAGGA